MKQPAENINHFWAALIVEELYRSGVKQFVISPGSRSTPLTIAVARHEKIAPVIHYDERAAAYCALGMAKGSRAPTALICTSGTAVANYLPAVVEASKSCVPLILLTADRPPELLDTGANQTIDQTKIFGDYPRWHFTLPCPTPDVPVEFVLTTIDQAVHRATRSPAGPVHLNCQYREPLAPTAAPYDIGGNRTTVDEWAGRTKPFTTYNRQHTGPDSFGAEDVLRRMHEAARGILVVGQLDSPAEATAVKRLAEELSWPVLPDIASGLRIGPTGGPYVPYYDQLLLSPNFRDQFTPDVVLHIGGPITSKRLQNHLKAAGHTEYIRVVKSPFRIDSEHSATLRIEATIDSFCQWLCRQVSTEFRGPWLEAAQAPSRLAHNIITNRKDETENLDEAGVATLISQYIERDSVLFLGNSMPIRDMDMYAAVDGPGVWVTANRGASGIDGNIATAAGWARASRKSGANWAGADGHRVVGVIGDLAALHDLNSLSLLKYPPQPVTLVIINNDGGGIFEFLPIAGHTDVFEQYFATPHGLNFHSAANQFGLDYFRPANAAEFVVMFADAQGLNRSSIIEVVINRKRNKDAHLKLQDAIVKAVDGTP